MAAGEPAGFGYWIGVLVDSGGLNLREEVPRDKRSVFRRLARFLVVNEFDHVKQLCGGTRLVSSSVLACVISGILLVAGTDPSRWPGSDAFLQSELDLLRPLVRGARSRSPVKQQHTRWARSGVCVLVHVHWWQDSCASACAEHIASSCVSPCDINAGCGERPTGSAEGMAKRTQKRWGDNSLVGGSQDGSGPWQLQKESPFR